MSDLAEAAGGAAGSGEPSRTSEDPPAPGLAAKGAFLVALALLALLFTLAARSGSEVAEDARLGRRVELVELIRAEQARVAALAARVDELRGRVAAFEQDPPGDPAMVRALTDGIAALAAPVGLTAVRGPGIVVTLADSTLSSAPSGDLNDLVIHEQDLQGVINGLWAGGAEAMSVNGQRVLATTAIRCVGNTLLLHGNVYSPPYVIRAVGDTEVIRAALDRDPAVARFKDAVREFQLGFTLEEYETLTVPAYEGLSSLQAARPAGSEAR